MKKLFKLGMKVLPVVIMIILFAMPTILGATGGVISIGDAPGTGTATVTKGMVENLWGVIRTVLQIAALGALIFSGVRYMFASADQKADIKKSMGILVLGALIVFGSTIVIDIITKIAKDITGVV